MTPRIAELADYMKKRQAILLAREGGMKPPWTSDKILDTGRFCNVFREDDRVTKWIDKNIREPYILHPHLWFMLCIARYINWPPTLQFLITQGRWPDNPDFHPINITYGLQDLAKTGMKVYTSAYMIRAESNPKVEWYSWTKHKYIAEIVLGRLWEDREDWQRVVESKPTLEEVWLKFQAPRYIGWGPFMAYEVVTDLRHTRYLSLSKDIFTWANAGPGAIRGLNRLYGRELNNKPKPSQTNQEMYIIQEEMNNTAKLWPIPWPRLEMRDVEHNLCEFDKYERVRLGEGQMRSKYNPSLALPL